jgi:hypothetical protein
VKGRSTYDTKKHSLAVVKRERTKSLEALGPGFAYKVKTAENCDFLQRVEDLRCQNTAECQRSKSKINFLTCEMFSVLLKRHYA